MRCHSSLTYNTLECIGSYGHGSIKKWGTSGPDRGSQELLSSRAVSVRAHTQVGVGLLH